MPILEIRNLHISIKTQQGRLHAVRGVDIALNPGEIVGILGESGAGKSMTMRAVTGLIPPDARIDEGEILFDGRSLLGCTEAEMMCIRGTQIAYVAQNPTAAINPIITVGRQMTDALIAKKKAARLAARLQLRAFEKQHGIKLLGVSLAAAKKKLAQLDGAAEIEAALDSYHRKYTKAELKAECIRMLERVGIDQPRLRYGQYPFELSGGMNQRVVIAMALLGNPRLVICDEPTTSLDVTSQAKIIQLISQLQKELNFALVFISHNLAVIGKLCNRVYVMYAGVVVEEGGVHAVYNQGMHPYTKALFDALPVLDKQYRLRAIPGAAPSLVDVRDMDQFADRNPYALEIDYKKEPPLFQVAQNHKVRSWLAHPMAKALKLEAPRDLIRREASRVSDEIILRICGVTKRFANRFGATVAANDVSFCVRKGEIFALVGESGSGKTTLGKIISGIQKPDAGEIYYRDVLLSSPGKVRRDTDIQMVFQDANASLNPRMTVGELVAEGLVIQRRHSKQEIEEKVRACLREVALDENIIDRYPFEISGGQRQRVEIARALIVDPCCLIADEPVSDLDASVQAGVLNLFDQIRRERDISIIFITHDISVVQYLADRVGVLYKGRLVELADKGEIFRKPLHPYTRSLFASAPSLSIRESLQVLPEVPFDETLQYEFQEAAPDHFVLTGA
ncbi:MAG: ABC transporter ATP-binding protein [Oscillospiraceae bacterium]|nr:ABC transporter ATP-binding protein [Oscillospiraceae bacterium]